MKLQNLDHVSAGLIVMFDASTGDVFHIREKIIETVDGKPACSMKITPQECEQLRDKIARQRPGCRVDAIIASSDTEHHDHLGSKRYRVDPMTRKLWIEKLDDPRVHHFGHQCG